MPRRPRHLLLPLLLVSACASGGAMQSPLAAWMSQHATLAHGMRDAVVAANLELFHDQAEALQAQMQAGVAKSFGESKVRPVRDALAAAQAATDVPAAARATAQMAAACGGCHLELDGPVVPKLPQVAEGASLPEQMRRHHWAMERIWESQIAPSPRAWSLAFQTLKDHPMDLSGAPEGVAQEVGAKAAEVRALAERGLVASEAAERTEVYGALLGQCGACHQALGFGR